MSPITKIALRRLRNNRPKSIFLAVAVFLSMTIVSLLVFFELQTLPVQDPNRAEPPIHEFLDKLRSAMNITIAFLVAITAIIIRIHCAMRNEDNRPTLAVLTSVGATGTQKRKLLHADMLLLYTPPMTLGILTGILPGIQIGKRFGNVWETRILPPICYLLAALLLIAAAWLLVSLCNYLPSLRFKRHSVIQSVKKQNRQASEERHGYRESRTYRSQTLLKRLAKKSIDYYAKTYNRIAVSFASAALYPILSVLLFGCIGNAEVVIDDNPYDTADTSAAMLAIMDDLLLFLGIGFFVLTCMGILQALLMSRVQIAARKSTTHTYLSIGMPGEDINRMIRLELRSVICRVVIMLIFAVAIIGTCYRMAV